MGEDARAEIGGGIVKKTYSETNSAGTPFFGGKDGEVFDGEHDSLRGAELDQLL